MTRLGDPRSIAAAAKWLVSAALLAAVLVFVLATFGPADLAKTAGALSASTLLLLFLAVLANALIASIRLKIISADVGHPIGFRNAVAAVSAGSIGGVLFFQLAGQLMARGAILSRHGLEFPTVVVITAYERAVAAILSGLLAMAGAYHIFGQIMIDGRSGGAVFLKLIAGLIIAGTVAGLIGYGRHAVKAVAPFMTQRFAARFLRSIVLSLAVQLPMMAAYVAAAHGLSPTTPIADLAAASAIVMFAASVPISLAGWGVREMSAVLALGAIGVGADQAFVAAAAVGVGSLAAMALLAAASSRAWVARRRDAAGPRESGMDYGKALAWGIPLATSVLILFQLHLPVRSATVNVNLADPLAILGGVLFLLIAWRHRSAPQWRLPWLNLALAAMTLVLTFALLLGAAEFGWTTWAVTNKYAGWFVLLGFALTGALIVKTSGESALRIVLLSFAGAAAAIAALDLLLTFVAAAGYRFPEEVIPSPIVGFAQNRNAFAFQMLMAIAAVLAAAQGRALRVTVLALALAGMVLCGSRAGWMTLPFLFGAALYLRATSLREMGLALAAMAALIGAIALAPYLMPGGEGSGARSMAVFALPEETSTDERLKSWLGAWHLFLESPIWGAGLGAYIHESTETGRALVVHSSVLWLLAETGIVGLAVFVVPALASLVSELRRPEPDLAGKVIVFCIAVFAVMSAAHEMIYQRSLWFLLGAAMACLPAARAGFSKRGAGAAVP